MPSITFSQISWSPPDGRAVFSDLNLQLQPERTGIIGRNGVGKSTLLRLLTGELTPAAGHVAIDGSIAMLRQTVQVEAGESIADLVAGLFASWSIMAALVQRNATGQGATLDVAMYDALFSMLTTSHAQHLYSGILPGRVGNRHPLSTPFGCFATSDGQVVIAVLNTGQFERLAALIGKPEIAADPRFASDSSRTEHEPALRALIEAWSSVQTTEMAVAALAAQGLPTAPIWDITKAIDNDHARTRGLVSQLTHPVLGQAPVVGQPVRFDSGKPLAATAAPGLGCDLEAVLKEMGLEEFGLEGRA